MGTLTHVKSGTEYVLSSQHVVGRDARCDLRIEDGTVSALHAELRWNGSLWEIRDLNTVNGTFVDGDKLEGADHVPVEEGARLAFGDPENVYELSCQDPPTLRALGPGGKITLAEAGLLALPHPDNPLWTIFEDRGSWVAESCEGERRGVADRETLRVEDEIWTLDLPVVTPETRRSDDGVVPLANATLRFSVSRDEETVELDLIHHGRATRLPTRVYWYTLLTLARARLEDRENPTISAAEEGWMYTSELTAKLAIGPGLLHQYICRARQTLSRAGVLGFADIVERRPGTRKLRLGVDRFEIASL